MTEGDLPQIHHLLVIEDKQGKRTVALKAATCSIGRDPNNSIVINSQFISHQHAILLRVTTPDTANYLFRLIDSNLQVKRSPNGLTVNGQRCLAHDLKHGDVIIFGGDVKARYYASANLSDIELLTSCESEELSSFLSNLSNPFETIASDTDLDTSSEAAFVRLASLPELISNPILEINQAGAITYLNPAAIAQFPDIREAKLQHPILADLLASVQYGKEKFFVREVEVEDKLFEQSIHYIAESNLIRSYVVDITERKRAEEALQRSFATNRALLNAIPDLMFRISGEGIFVNFKAAKDSNLLVPPDEFLGKSLYEVLPIEVAQPAMDCIQRALQTNHIQIFEYQLPQPAQPNEDHLTQEASQLRGYEARIVMSAENEVMAIVRDITERQRAEEALRQAHDKLEIRVEERTAELAQANEQLRNAEKEIHKALEKEKELGELKSRFVTMTSHEFRTPLATILSSTELLEHYSHKWGEEKKLVHLRRIQTAVKNMTQLLNDVLLIGKAEAGKLELNPVPLDLTQLCHELLEEIQLSTTQLQNRCPTHSIAFCSESQCANAVMDEKLLRHILSNLLSNAIKYSPKGGTVHFDLVCQQQEVTFRVQDEGIGIPLADQAQLFNSFHRASNVGTISGTGLGLAIVKRSVDAYGGTIAVQSKVGVGTTFTVTLPCNKQV